jgi:DNA-binding response OmpR family regulator
MRRAAAGGRMAQNWPSEVIRQTKLCQYGPLRDVMKKVLLIDDDPLICDCIVDWFGDKFGMEVLCPRRGMLGARMMMSLHFDLAIIDVDVPEISGLELAAFAANENIPVLLTSSRPGKSDQLGRLRYPFLAKPFKLLELTAEVVRVIAESHENIRRVKESAAKMLASTEGLSVAVAESRRLLQEIKAQQVARGQVPAPTGWWRG